MTAPAIGHRALTAAGVTAVALLAALGQAAAMPATAAGPRPDAVAAKARGASVGQLVAFRGGGLSERRVRASTTVAKVGRRRCAVARGTALAALVRSHAGRLGIRDYGSCSRARPNGSGQLFVRSIRGQRNRGRDGWVYKVGRRLASAGSADPAGAFGSGRLRPGQRVTWFYCRMRSGGCQRTLTLSVAPRAAGGLITVGVRGYDDQGRGEPVAGATVSGAGRRTQTDAAGRARLALPRGRHRLRARKSGLVTSFAEPAVVR